MNERIRLLAEQAGLLSKEIGPVVETRHMKKKEQDLEKFAEMIVRECGKSCTLQDDEDHMFSKFGIKHFGVDE